MATVIDKLKKQNTGLYGVTGNETQTFTIPKQTTQSNLLSGYQLGTGPVPFGTTKSGLRGVAPVTNIIQGTKLVPAVNTPTPVVTSAPVPVATKPATSISKPATVSPKTVEPPRYYNGVLTDYGRSLGLSDGRETPREGSAAAIEQGTGYSYSMSPEERNARKAYEDFVATNETAANQVIDPKQIYNENLAKFQASIDATNKIYADRLNQARIQGQGRIESRQFSQGRSGQIGSGTGEAGINAVQDSNTQNENAIVDEGAVAVENILSDVRKNTDTSVREKTAAKKAGAEALLKYYDEIPAKKEKQVQDAVKKLILNGVKELSSSQLNSFIKGLGVSKEDFTAEWESQVGVLQEAENKKIKEEEAAKAKALPASVQEYEYAKANGYTGSFTQYQTEDANRKKVNINNAAPKQTLSERHAETVSNLSQFFTPGSTIPGSDGVPVIDDNGYATPEGFKTAMSAAQADGLPRKDFIVQFGYTIPTGLEFKFGLTPAEIKMITGALPEVAE